MFRYFLQNIVLKNFFKIELSGLEKELALESVQKKHIGALKTSFFFGLLALPAILFIDTIVLVSALVPITMVSGTAWYAVSLANVKKKFEQFGLELTTDLVRSFVTSLILLVLIVLVSINPSISRPAVELAEKYPFLPLISGLLGTLVVIKLVYDIYVGSVKYDINDSMLAGQSESAEKYFRKSLSILNTCSENLKKNDDPVVSNYYIGLAFYEIFSFVVITKGYDPIFQAY